MRLVSYCIGLSLCFLLQACNGVSGTQTSEQRSQALENELTEAINVASQGLGNAWLTLPESTDYDSIPQDPANPINDDSVALGKMLFHDTGIATKGQSKDSKSWSCATCHHAAAGFKAGVPQGIGEGGIDFGTTGTLRRLSPAFDAMAEKEASNKPDIQPFASPSILNSAYQDVMLWNGQFGNRIGGLVNVAIADNILSTAGTPKKENKRRLAGLETQAIAGMDVHRLSADDLGSKIYTEEFNALRPRNVSDKKLMAGMAIAAYERTVLANRAPFQQWLKGDSLAMADAEKRGALLFFGSAGCADCHRGPALSSEINATADDLFMAIGFADFNPESQPLVHGAISDADKKGRGGFTQDSNDDYKFKIPQLYNLADADVFGHGASFTSIREVLNYKNAGAPQNLDSLVNLDDRFKALNLTSQELDDLEAFLTTGLYDADLLRYQPTSLPTGECIVVDPHTIETNGLCP